MLSDEVIEKVISRITTRIEETNTYVLKKMGESVAKFRSLTPTQANQLAQIMRYGGDYDKIVQALAKMSKLNIQDIYKIFEEVAKKDYAFAKQFYNYRGIKHIPYKENTQLQNQVKAIATITAGEYNNITRTMGFATIKNGKVVYTDIATTYQNMLDRAVLSVSQGVDTFDNEMYRIVKELASSGIKTVDYASDRSYRVDSAVRMALQGGIRDLHMEMQQEFGKQFGANMVEVSHHANPAKDHEDTVDGKQFAMIDTIIEQIQSGLEKEITMDDIQGDRVKVKGKWYYDFNYINNGLERPVGTLNCYHYTFVGILGISKPTYSKEELEEAKQKNNQGIYYEGKHYTLYETEQLMRKLELELRKAKDEQIMGRASGIAENVVKAQDRITELTHKYKEIIKISGLSSKLDRAKVSGYRKIKVADK